MNRRYSLAGTHIGIAVAAFAVASIMGVLQALSVADIHFPHRDEGLYYMSVTAHGVLMALVFTTFFIMGLGYLLVQENLGRIVGRGAAWFAFWLAAVGSVAAAVTILRGQSTVLYTFYPPLQAHPLFYIGATALIIGSWIWGGVTIASFRAWRRENPGAPIPLSIHGMLATIIIWYLATAGLAMEVLGMLIPWSLHWVKTIDPVLARTYFWWFGHPLVYFWLLPAYVLWYTVLPQVAGGRLFSDKLGRLVFVMFVLLSVPVGFHHQFSDPGIGSGWKLLHTMLTFSVAYPSLVTAFTVIASLEVAGRMKGAKGLFNWIGKLPWLDPFFASCALAMLAFTFGGFGGAINAAYAMNTMVHNTAWIMGHFHVTLGTTVAMTFMGGTYWLLPRISGRELRFKPLALLQPYLWFAGMMLFSVSYHIAGLRGLPRRVYSASLNGEYHQWHGLSLVAAAGAIVLAMSALCYVLVAAATWLTGKKFEATAGARVSANVGDANVAPAFEFAKPLQPAVAGVWDRFGLWTVVAIGIVIAGYAYPILHLLTQHRYGSPPFQPF